MELRKFIKTTIREYLNENKNTNKRKSRLITESKIQGKTIINVDIQPEYKKYISFNLRDWVNFINRNAALNDIVFLYNGADTLGMIDEYSFKEWLVDLGIDEDVVENATFYDKGYAFFRYCMDNSIDEDNIVDLIKYMIRHNINNAICSKSQTHIFYVIVRFLMLFFCQQILCVCKLPQAMKFLRRKTAANSTYIQLRFLCFIQVFGF